MTVRNLRRIWILALAGAMSVLGAHEARAQCPAAPTLTAQAAVCDGSVSLSWNAVNGAFRYDVFRSTDGVNWGAAIGGSNGTTYVDSSPPQGVQVFYRVRGIANMTLQCFTGLGAPSNAAPVTPNGVAAPTESATLLSSTWQCGQGNSWVTWSLAWTPVARATSYELFVYSGSNLADFRAVTQPSVDIIPLDPRRYVPPVTVVIVGKNACGDGPSSSTRVDLSNQGPGSPGALRIAAAPGGAGGGLVVSWPGAPGAAKYFIERSTSSGSGYLSAEVLGTEFHDHTLPAGAIATYTVLSVDACGSVGPGSTSIVQAAALAAPTIKVARAPRSVTHRAGETAKLSVALTRTLPTGPALNFIWIKGGSVVPESPRFRGTTTGELTITDLQRKDAGVYEVVVRQGTETPIVLQASIEVAGACASDFDGDGVRSVDDIFVFINSWFAGCP